jgi:hypothetical protein
VGLGSDIRGGKVTRKEVRFSVTPEEWDEIMSYVKAKRRWHQISHFVRDCVYREMARNPAGRHDNRGGERTEASGGEE